VLLQITSFEVVQLLRGWLMPGTPEPSFPLGLVCARPDDRTTAPEVSRKFNELQPS
jgi:hypothetical protein